MDVFADFIAGIDDESHRERVVELLSWVSEAFPTLGTAVKWKQPMFTDHGTFIIGFSVAKNHIAVAPEPYAVAHFAAQLDEAEYSRTNMLFRIGWDQKLDYDLMREIIEFNIEDKKGYSPFWRTIEWGTGQRVISRIDDDTVHTDQVAQTAAASLHVVNLGLMDYSTALQVQERVLAARIDGRIGDTLLLVEHPPVLTIGKHADLSNVLAPDEELLRRGVAVVQTTRGGDVTYHGPGQLVGYPIIRLRSRGVGVRDYVRGLELSLSHLLEREYGIEGAKGSDIYPGVWVGAEKIAAIGVAVQRAVTYHGLALNANVDLSAFNLIVPCGISGRGVTSIECISGTQVDMETLRAHLVRHLSSVFGFTPIMVTLESLLDMEDAEDLSGQR